MASRLYITCWRHQATDDFGRQLAAPMTPPLSELYIDITHESIASDPFPQYTAFISLHAEDDCAVAFGNEPVADPDFHKISAGERVFYGAQPGMRVAAIEITR